jgi:hypothetical protein
MASKILASLLAVAVLSVGGYTYWQYADGHCCGPRTATSTGELSTGCPSTGATAPCCEEPSRTSCPSLSTDSPCCEDAPTSATAEVLAVQPREVK